MSIYAVTGSASGMGLAVAERLRAAGHTVIGVDLHDAEVIADLSSPEGRAAAISAVLDRARGRLAGAVLAAGLGPQPGREAVISEVNFFATTELLTAWRAALAAAAVDGISSKVVVFASNSATIVPGVPRALVRGFLQDRPASRARVLRLFGTRAATFAYAGSKLALSRWVRRTAVSSEWAEAGIRLNAIAPGAVLTPLLQTQLEGPDRAQVEALPIPVGGYGDAGEIADWVLFMLSPAAEFMCGSVVFVDGGSDAYFRSDDWPDSLSLLSLPRWLRLSREFGRRQR